MADEKEKVFTYMDMMYFSASLKLVVSLCEKLKLADLAQKVGKYLQDKETREVFEQNMPKKGTQAGVTNM